MFRQDRTNPGTAVSNWRGRRDSKKAWPSTAVSSWLNGGLFGGGIAYAAYFAGGYDAVTDAAVATIDKFTFSDDSRTTLGTGLSAANYGVSGCANSGVAGYFAGGGVTTVDKLDFSDDSRTSLSTGLNQTAQYNAGAANSGVAAYFASGLGSINNSVDKFAFSDDSRTTLYLAAQRGYLAGAANSGTAAYFAGGQVSYADVDTVEKFAFSDDSRTTLGTGLSAATGQLAGAANSGTAAYFGGGYSAGNVATVDKFAFSDDSRSTLGTGLSSARRQLTGAANSGTAAYFAGGEVGHPDPTALVTTVDKFAFSDDSRSTLGTGLSLAVKLLAGLANSETLA